MDGCHCRGRDLLKGMYIGQLVAIKLKSPFGKWEIEKAILVDRTVNEEAREEWHALINGHVVKVAPWQIGPVEIVQRYRERNERAAKRV